ncbi:hypothetical protein CJJ19_09050 [Candidatus Williamhamiltonella defendens]|nr:helix-turn-helix domain-containing protein [Candidatus Hamiltonella defensa]AYB49564.1 hypothetical protein CJJ19_09050 [Candidatus Hamiltonella defensa]
MSMTLMTQVMNHISVGNPLRKLILLKLADHADEKGACWPSYQHIATVCECSKSTVKLHIQALIRLGLVRKIPRAGTHQGNASNLYYLTLKKAMAVEHIPSLKSTKPESTGDLPPGQLATPLGDVTPRSGSGDDPPPGATADTRISQSFEPVKEPVIKPNTQNAPKFCFIDEERVFSKNPNPVSTEIPLRSKYAFEGHVIKLNPEDLTRWESLFPHLDLPRELARLDLEFTHDPPKSWFSVASAKLNYQNRQAIAGVRWRPKSSFNVPFQEKDYGETRLPAWALEGA